ncbi:gas vesicle protein GvpG [Microlunatus soli]|uniref:Gas vesicle protein G n=1 Tax=Microlunatus soli TaxID=630515 RepID=A0A1H1NCI2_9ACTN|nr:gas vesicle protein GvpG [Microlunatus soli]SDR96652.1 Gas vesicle protein G [Microlunatus soli]
MGLLSSLVGLPLAPVKGTVWVAERVYEEAERQFYDPERIRREFDEIDQLRRDGDLDPEAAESYEEELIARLMEGPG